MLRRQPSRKRKRPHVSDESCTDSASEKISFHLPLCLGKDDGKQSKATAKREEEVSRAIRNPKPWATR